MKHLVVLVFLLLNNALVAAQDAHRVVELNYRSPLSMQQTLQPLLNDSTSITVDHQRLLIRGLAAEVNGLMDLIQSLDKPLPQLKISLYRGQAPALALADKKRYKTTDAGINSTDTVIAAAGTVIRIEEESLSIIDTEQTAIEGVHIDQASGKTTERFNAVQQGRQLLKQSNTIRFSLELLASKNVVANITLEQNLRPDEGETNNRQRLSLERTLPMGEWVQLIDSSQSHFEPALNNKRKVASTNKQGWAGQSVWIYVTLAE